MQKILIVLCMLLLSLNAAELKWADTYTQAIEKAKKQNKNVMLLITTKTCRWCRKLESTTLKNQRVIERLNRDYISVHVTRDVDDYPSDLQVKGVPTTYFLNVQGAPMIRKVMGYWNVDDYLSFLDDVDYKLGKKEY